MTLQGRQLESHWNGIQAQGEGSLEPYSDSPISWTITCLWDSGSPADGSYPDLGDITHLLTLKLRDSHGRPTVPAFTVSYKQFGQPSILRFEPRYVVPTSSNADFPEWRTPAFPFAIDPPAISEPLETPQDPESTEPQELSEPPTAPLAGASQKSLAAGVKKFEGRIKETAKQLIQGFKKLGNTFCPKKHWHGVPGKIKYQSPADILYGGAEHDELESSEEPSSVLETPTTIRPHVAAETRALHSEASSTEDATTPSEDSQSGIPSAVVLKTFFLSLILFYFFTWLVLRYRDPRRRAERAAEKEERHTKRLYRQAARRQKVVNIIWQFRMKWGLASTEVLRWDEKSRRVSEQDAVLENIFNDDIQGIRDATRAVSSMNGPSAGSAEEGRSGWVYEEDGLGHRRLRSTRSVSTLPEYQSDGSRPPSYRETGRRDSLGDFPSDSSVVSTSPRISRDGTNSDFEEKIEEIDLRDTRVDGIRPCA